MKKAVSFIRDCGVFFLATTDNGEPRVRPQGAIAELNGRVYICSGKSKEACRQMLADPHVEISALNRDRQWIRIRGTVAVDPSPAARAAFLSQFPGISARADDGEFQVFYLKEGTASISSFTAEPEMFRL